ELHRATRCVTLTQRLSHASIHHLRAEEPEPFAVTPVEALLAQRRPKSQAVVRQASSAVEGASDPDAFRIRYVLMNPSRSPSSTRSTSPTSSFVRWSFTIW